MEKYEFLSRTGEGAYGSVWRARDKNTGVMVAVKKMKDVPTNEEEGEIAMREVRVLQLAKHVNIVNLMEAYKSQSGRLYLVFEYVERTLLQELKANRCGLPAAAVKSITWQLLQAIGYLHRKQIIHRDVKPSNILLTENGVVKICDFGFARACSNTAADPAYTTYVVTRWYRPPEVLVGDTYGPPVDIWALGCIFAEMLLGRPLFPGRNHHDQLWLIIKSLGCMTERQLDLLDADPQFACFRLPSQSEIKPLEQRLSSVGPAALQLLRACLDPDPKRRASAEELLAMPYFNGVTDALPIDDLSAYPDPEMRSKLDRVLAQDQANAAAAAAREAVLLLAHSTRRLTAPLPPPPTHLNGCSKAQQPAPAAACSGGGSGGGGASPSRLASLQVPPGAPPPAPPLPAKAATAVRLEPCSESQRPPLQRYVTAPPGTMAARAGAGPQQLQPLAEQFGQHLLHQRSRPGSESSQHSSPRTQQQQHQQQQGPVGGGGGSGTGSCSSSSVQGLPAPSTSSIFLGPARGRSGWRVSSDGSVDGGGGSGPLHPAGRQLYGLGRQPLQPSSTTAGVSAAGGGGGGAASGALDAASRAASEQLPAATQRPAYQRATWNGAGAPPRSNGGAGSSGGAGAVGGGGNAACGGPPGSYLGSALYCNSSTNLNVSNGNSQPLMYETFTLHRKAHSLAGYEGLPPATSAAVGIRNVAGLGGLQGRSLAPPLAQGVFLNGSGNGSGGSSSLPQGGAFQLTSSQSCVAAAGGIVHRNSVSPPPLAYGMLRGANSVPLGPIMPAGCPVGRVSHDGVGGNGAPHHNVVHPLRPLPQVVAVNSTVAGQFASNGNSGSCEPSGLEAEASEGSLAEAAIGRANEGRRASDTVLYAALALRDPKGRADKAAQHLLLVPGPRPQFCPQQQQQQHQDEGGTAFTGGGSSSGGAASSGGGGGSSSGGGSFGLGCLRATSFGRSGLAAAGPASPDCSLPANLPPLQVTPQRRISAPEAMAIAVLSGGGAAASGSTSRVNMNPGGGGGGGGASHSQRHRHPGGQQHGHPAAHHGHAHPHPAGYQHLHLMYGGTGNAAAGAAAAASAGACSSGSGSELSSSDIVNNGNGTAHVLLPSLDVGFAGKSVRISSAGHGPNSAAGAGTAIGATSRRPGKSTLMRVYGPDAHCKREDSSKILLLEAVPEASVL